MAYETILYEVADGVATLTLNRPDSYNALTQAMYTEILHALKQAERDSSVRALRLTGAGKAFCSGADLRDVDTAQTNLEVGDMLRVGLNEIVLALRGLPKPIVCAMNGVAAGAGASLTLACDYRIASQQASYVFAAFASIGIIPDSGLTYLLPQYVGVGKALELVLLADSGNRLAMDEAQRLNIVNRVVPPDDLAGESMALAHKLANMATRAISMTKRAMYRAADQTLADALEYEAQLQTAAFRTADFREGVQAFLEKRPPVFKGE